MAVDVDGFPDDADAHVEPQRTDARADQLRLLDTFALEAMMTALADDITAKDLVRTRRIVELLSAITTRPICLRSGDGLQVAQRCVAEWRRWWRYNRLQHVRLVGMQRLVAIASETRYGKWVLDVLALELEPSSGVSVLTELMLRAEVTLGLTLLALVIAYLLAIPLGTWSALYRSGVLDRTISAAVLLPHVMSPAVLGMLLLATGPSLQARQWLALVVLAAVMLADPTRQLRAELLPELAQDYARAAKARGASPLRVVVVHGLRNALLPLVTRGALELPVAVTGAFVVERVFGLHGLGEATVEAVRSANVSWLMFMALTATALAVVALIATDVVYAMLDPRLQEVLSRSRRGRT